MHAIGVNVVLMSRPAVEMTVQDNSQCVGGLDRAVLSVGCRAPFKNQIRNHNRDIGVEEIGWFPRL